VSRAIALATKLAGDPKASASGLKGRSKDPKGQYSPTSELGKITKSTPLGSLDRPFNPLALALGSPASFVARAIARDTKHLHSMIHRSNSHNGSSFLEIYQNCNIFNDGAFAPMTDRETKADTVLWLENKKPLLFGAEMNKGIIVDGNTPKVIELGDKWGIDDLLVHDETDWTIAMMLSHFTYQDDFPNPIGVFYCVDEPVYDAMLDEQIKFAIKNKGNGNIQALIDGADNWVVE
jgi:2-oxoglutarate ferredoxin oxidoreductase subunit beta